VMRNRSLHVSAVNRHLHPKPAGTSLSLLLKFGTPLMLECKQSGTATWGLPHMPQSKDAGPLSVWYHLHPPEQAPISALVA
jgi:hypothetical protein